MKLVVPRPTENDDDVVRRHMALIRPRVAAYLSQHSARVDLDQAMADIEEAMDCEDDGYRIASSLEDAGWNVNADLVAEMDSLVAERDDALAEAEAEWARVHGSALSLVVGAQVVIVGGHPGAKGQFGEVVEIDVECAKCTVMVPALGHVRTGCGTLGLVLNMEDVTARAALDGGAT